VHTEELHNLYASSNTVRMTKSRRIRLAGHVTRIGEMRNKVKVKVNLFL
jgi:hypothetical protein